MDQCFEMLWVQNVQWQWIVEWCMLLDQTCIIEIFPQHKNKHAIEMKNAHIILFTTKKIIPTNEDP